MKVIGVHQITVPDNQDQPPGVVPIPQQAFEATLSYEKHQEVLKMLREGTDYDEDQ